MADVTGRNVAALGTDASILERTLNLEARIRLGVAALPVFCFGQACVQVLEIPVQRNRLGVLGIG